LTVDSSEPQRSSTAEDGPTVPGAAGTSASETPDESAIDYRFTLANERTFLAWIRTALGLLAGGVAVHTLVQPFHHAGVHRILAMMCIVLAVIVAVGAYTHWRDVGRSSMRALSLRFAAW
jgi:putative membrane protein